MQPIKLVINMNLIHQYYSNDENFYNSNPLQSAVNFGIISVQSQKTIASRGKLNYLTLANDSTPFNRAFFVRNNRTPKEYADFVFNLNPIILSMVERNEPSMTGCLPIVAVFHLVTFYRPTVESLAVVPENLTLELTQMYQFIFALSRAPQIKIRLLADTEQQARSRFTDGDTLLFVGRINQNPKLTPAVDVKAESYSVNNHRLPVGQNVGSIESTTNESGKHNRYFSAIFLSKIHSLHVPKKLGTLSYIEFATRLRDRTKALSTNKIRRLSSVVDTLLHPIMGDNSLLTKTRENPTMKIYPQNNRTSLTNGNNHRLPVGQNVGSIESTTTIEGNRNPYQCGIFLSQIPFNGYGEDPYTYQQAEFAVQMISRNKAEFIRTNKASRSIAVVESVSHPFMGDTLTLTKSIGNPTMKIYPKNNRTLAALPTLSVSATQGGANA